MIKLQERDSDLRDIKGLKLHDIVLSTNQFSANGWSYEIAEKYIFSINGTLVEAGFYTHYADEKMDRIIKRVIELPTSYGCPMKCAFCASSCISYISALSSEMLCLITDILIDAHEIANDNDILIALTGTGDAYYTLGLISEYITVISQKYNNLSFTVSSCYWTVEMLKKIEELTLRYKFRNIQSTFISTNDTVVKQLIPGLRHIDYNIFDFVSYIKDSEFRNWRINYLILKSVNDDDNSFNKFLEMIRTICDKVIVRISSLNETIASQKSGLKPSVLQRSKALQKILTINGVNSYLFYSEHVDNMNCGQLVLESTLAKQTTLAV